MIPRYRRGLFALSGDPVTFGHLDLIAQASAKCQELLVLVANNAGKKCLFTLDERVAMARRAAAHRGLDNVRVTGDEGLLVDVFLREDCDRLFRGIRNDSDVEYEKTLATINSLLLPDIGRRIEMLRASTPLLQVVSSTVAKQVTAHHGDLERFVPLFVKQAMEERMLGQYLVGITGRMATGKSWVADALVSLARSRGLQAHKVNVDVLLRNLYEEQSPGAQRVREDLAAAFGADVLTPDFRGVNRAALAGKLYSYRPGEDARAVVGGKLATAQRITQPHVQRLFRAALPGLKGLVVVEWAQLLEMGMSPWVNGNVIVVDCPQREKLVVARGISRETLGVADMIQWDASSKQAGLLNCARRDGNGEVILHVNVVHEGVDGHLRSMDCVGRTLDRVLTLFPALRQESVI